MPSDDPQRPGDGTKRQHTPVEVPADDGKNYRDLDSCEGCGADKDSLTALRAIKMRAGRRRLLCRGCFREELDRDTVDPSDPRVAGKEAL